jgi:hypothetical protein
MHPKEYAALGAFHERIQYAFPLKIDNKSAKCIEIAQFKTELFGD